MPNILAAALRGLVPPLAVSLYQRVFEPPVFSRPYATWEAAQRASTGYDADAVIERVRVAATAVKAGRAAYERDGVTFDDIQYAWPTLASLMWVAARTGGRLSLVDFGGALGTSYFQCRKFLAGLSEVRWNVVEQPRFVEVGRRDVADERLAFFPDVDSALATGPCDAVLLSGVLPYLERPYELLELLSARGFRWIVIDRTPLLESGDEYVTVHHVPEHIYRASYPAWFLNRRRMLQFLSGEHTLVEEWRSFETYRLHEGVVHARGFLFERKGATGSRST